ncbi:hypothetical protein [Muricoccus radiodurans]|uniref:hypothetical protein n=1 Tax=Muricoccus radiodurans TaxID=2231721 RepID=UPI003CFB6F84
MIGIIPASLTLSRSAPPLIGSGTLLSGVTLTRASKAWVRGTDDVSWAEMTNDQPRFQGGARRLLVEGARTNLVRNPRAQGVVGGTPGTPPTNAQMLGGNANGFGGITYRVVGAATLNGLPAWDVEFTCASAAAISLINFEVGLPIAAGAYTWSAMYQAVSGTAPGLTQLLGSNVGDLASQAFSPGAAASRPEVRVASSGSATNVWPSLKITAAGFSGTFVLRIAAPQLEQAGFASTPVLPSAGTVAASTRATDFLAASLPALGIAGDFTIWGRAIVPSGIPGGMYLLSADDGTNNNRAALGWPGGTSILNHSPTAAGSFTGNSTIGATDANAFGFSLAVSSGRMAASLNGAAPVIRTTAVPTVTLTTLRVGNLGLGSSPMFGEIGPLMIRPGAVSDAALQSLSVGT